MELLSSEKMRKEWAINDAERDAGLTTPSFVMTSYHDFLRKNAKPMYDALTTLGVPCIIKEYGAEDKLEIAHVFHINMRLEEARQCNDDECEFFHRFIDE